MNTLGIKARLAAEYHKSDTRASFVKMVEKLVIPRIRGGNFDTYDGDTYCKDEDVFSICIDSKVISDEFELAVDQKMIIEMFEAEGFEVTYKCDDRPCGKCYYTLFF